MDKITCCCSTSDHILFGDANGIIHIMDRNLSVSHFPVFKRGVSHLKFVAPSFLVAVGDDGDEKPEDSIILSIFNFAPRFFQKANLPKPLSDQNSANTPKDAADTPAEDPNKKQIKSLYFGDVITVPLIKSWQIFRTINNVLGPTRLFALSKPIKAANSVNIMTVTSMDVSQDFTSIALGLGGGEIAIFYGSELGKGKALVKLIANSNSTNPISGVFLHCISKWSPQSATTGGADKAAIPMITPLANFIPGVVMGGVVSGVVGATTGLAAAAANTVTQNVAPNSQQTSSQNNQKPSANAVDNKSPWSQVLYVCSQFFSLRYILHGPTPDKMTFENPLIYDDIGCKPGCCCVDESNGDLITATDRCIWKHRPEGKGGCFVVEGKKLKVFYHKHYMVLVSQDFNRKQNMQRVVTIYDLENKVIVYRFASEKMNITHMAEQWGYLFLISLDESTQKVQAAQIDTLNSEEDAKKYVSSIDKKTEIKTVMTQTMYLLEEKDTQTKLEMLLSKHLYDVALQLVKTQNLDPQLQFDIFKKYGDHLSQKKDFDGAMEQYKKTIGKLEPSTIIRKFLDAQRIPNLVDYLETLHEAKVATLNHTTMLLNCYTKLKVDNSGVGTAEILVSKDSSADNDKRKNCEFKRNIKLENFLLKHTKYKYDVETAISVCRKEGYIQQALFLAEKFQRHDWFIKIHIEDFVGEQTEDNLPSSDQKCRKKQIAHYRKALRKIESLPLDQAAPLMQEYGKRFLDLLPKETTNVLNRLLTSYFPIPEKEINRQMLPQLKKLEEYIAAKKQTEAKEKERETKLYGAPTANATTPAAEDSNKKSEEKPEEKRSGMSSFTMPLEPTPDSAKKDAKEGPVAPKIEDFLQIYASNFGLEDKDDKTPWFISFLESVYLRKRPEKLPKAVHNTLLELYLHEMRYFQRMQQNPASQTEKLRPDVKDLYRYDDPVFLTSNNDMKNQPWLLDKSKQPNPAQNPAAASGDASAYFDAIQNIEKELLEEQECDYSIFAVDMQLQKKTYYDKIMDLLSSHSYDSGYVSFDMDHAFVLLQSYGFNDGILKLYENPAFSIGGTSTVEASKFSSSTASMATSASVGDMFSEEIVRFHLKQNNHKKVLESLFRCLDDTSSEYSAASSTYNLVIEALEYFVHAGKTVSQRNEMEEDLNDNNTTSDHNDQQNQFENEISTLLARIERDDLLPPLVVIEIISGTNSTKMKTIKNYLINQFKTQQESISEDEKRIKETQTDTEKLRKELISMKTSAKVFQATTCSHCRGNLELPAIHFMCGHSYHQNCLLDNGEECPLCKTKNREILQTKKKFESKADEHEQFFKGLQAAVKRRANPGSSSSANKMDKDGFSLIADYFGRGIFKKLTVTELEHYEDFAAVSEKKDTKND